MGKPYSAGRRFGRLEVMCCVGVEHGWRLYEMRCDCGNIVTVSSKLVAANKTSCGCRLAESRSSIGQRNGRDIAGLRSGRLVALRFTREQGRRRWICQCDCGNQTFARTEQITQQTLASCGCLHGKGVGRPSHVRRERRHYMAARRKRDIKYVVAQRIGNQIRYVLKGRKNGKSWQKLVGYTAEDLRLRLESTMPEGYSWAHFMSGALHIDHIIPVAVHNFKSPADEDFRKAFALDNLQLLPAAVNMRKRAKLMEPFQPSFAFSEPRRSPLQVESV